MHTRIKCSSYCILVGRNGEAYQGQLCDISLGGASVMINSGMRLKVGDFCQLMLSDSSAVLPMKRNGKVAWINTQNVGVSLFY
jgi:c-di-GMP-binding flagellar brake protein YcgR